MCRYNKKTRRRLTSAVAAAAAVAVAVARMLLAARALCITDGS
jgi:hypothetical protein